MTVKHVLIFVLLLSFLLLSIYFFRSPSFPSQPQKKPHSLMSKQKRPLPVKTEKTLEPYSPKKYPIQTSLNAKMTKTTPSPIVASWTGYKTFSLGTHSILLKGGEWKMKFTLTLGTQDPETYRMFSPLRRKLVRMLYFLGTHRVIGAFRTEGGEERFRVDFEKRVKNVIRNKPLTVDLINFELQRVRLDDEGNQIDPVQRTQQYRPLPTPDPEVNVYDQMEQDLYIQEDIDY